MPLLLIAFIVVPLVELTVIGRVADALGLPLTLVILLLDSLAGAVLVRREGRRAWDAFRRALSAGRWPGDEVTQGALVLIGGALLVTPGFVTDAVGLVLVAPPTRSAISRALRRRLAGRVLGPLAPTGGDAPGTTEAGGAAGRDAGRGRVRDDGRDGAGDVYDVTVVSVEREDADDQRDRRSDG